MRTTCVSWFPLATSDPVPGDPDGVQRAAERYGEVAEHIDRAVARITDITTSADMESRAVGAVRERADDIAKEVLKAKGRYEAIAQALGEYARSLRAAQHAADDLLARAVAVQHRIDDATTERTLAARALASLDPSATEADRRRVQGRLSTARTTVSDAEVELQHLRDKLEQVVRDHDAAAQRAIDAIGSAQAADRLDDGWWQDWGADAVRSISSIAGNVAAVTGVASLFLGWVPILGPILAGVALTASIVALAADITLLATGEAGWTNVLLGIAGLATFGAGRLVARGATRLAATSRSVAKGFPDVLLNSGNPQIKYATNVIPQRLTARAPTELRLADLRFTGSRGPAIYRAALDASVAQIRSTSGVQRILTLAGHGNMVADSIALTTMRQAVSYERAIDKLVPRLALSSTLQMTAGVIYVSDAAMGYGSIAKTIVDRLSPPPTPAERLRL